jgi:MFS family permease
MRDKAQIIRWVKRAEIGIMATGAAGLLMAWQGLLTEAAAIPLMLLALFAMGVHSTFFGPIKYAILPQHLEKDEVLGGTGLVEAGTYIGILTGTILGGTGRYAGATGSYGFSWQWVMESEDGALHGRAIDLRGRVKPGAGAGVSPR